MKERIALNPMQQSYLRGREAKYGRFSKACFVYEYDPTKVEYARLVEALQRLPQLHPLLGAGLDGETLVLGAGRLELQKAPLWAEGIEAQAETLFQQFTWNEQCLSQVTLVTGSHAYVALCINGILADGLSHDRILETLERCYEGEPLEPVECSQAFLDYMETLRAEQRTPEQAQALEESMRQFPPAAELAIAEEFYTPDPQETGVCRQPIAASLWQAFQQKAAGQGVTAFPVLLTLVGKAIGQYTDRSKVVLNVPRTARMVPVDGIFQAVGMYSDFSLVPVDAAGSDVFAQAKTLNISLMEQQFQGQISGLDRLKAWKKSDPQAAAPFVCTSLVDGAYDSRLFTRRLVRTQTAQVWLELLLLRCGDTVTLEAAYQPDVLPAMVVEQILCTVVADMEQLVYPVNRATEPAVNPCLPSLTDLLKQRFSTYRDHPFLLWSKGQLTYGQTDALANRLCQRLREAGLTSGSRVGILLSKSPLQAIASLAATKAGAAFLPLDLEYPPEMLSAIAHRAELSLIVTEPALAERAASCGVPCLTVEEAWLNAVPSQVAAFQGYRWRPEEVLVIINTSGTTGEPKSAAIPSVGVVNCLLESQRRFSLTDNDRCIAVTNYCHDMALFDLYGMIACGGSVVYPDGDKGKEPAHWAALMERYQVTFWNSVPAFMEMLAAEERNLTQALTNLHTVVMGGDFLPVSLVKQLKGEKPTLCVHSVGGPTETTIWNISHEITADDLELDVIPYGKPFPNTTYFICNAAGQPAPMGVIGEMCVAGVGVSAGYLGMPEKTAQAFPQWNHRRVYRTGDFGYFRANGDLMILGRRDGQVKINGKRIELPGIEAVLRAQPETNQVVVVKSAQNKKLTAFYTGAALEEDAWRAFAQEQLPSYMVPSRFVWLEQLPLTRNGKVDRKRLTQYQLTPAGQPAQTAAPTDCQTVTAQLIDLCRQLFPDEDIDENLNYYVIGGDSIQAIKLLSLIKRTFDVTLSAYDILEAPFLQEWAALIQQKQAQRNQLLQQLTGLAEAVVGVDGDALRLTDGVEVRLKSLSHRLAEQGIQKTVYELLAMPYLTEMGR